MSAVTIPTRSCPDCAGPLEYNPEPDGYWSRWYCDRCEAFHAGARAPITVEVDCHDHAYHVVDADYPECGPGNLVRIAEQYGILIEFLPEHEAAGWAWWYRLTGPPEHLSRFLTEEWGDPETVGVVIGDAS